MLNKQNKLLMLKRREGKLFQKTQNNMVIMIQEKVGGNKPGSVALFSFGP